LPAFNGPLWLKGVLDTQPICRPVCSGVWA